MNRFHLCLVIAYTLSGCTNDKVPPAPPAGDIAADAGGVVGYQHGLKHSKFIVGTDVREKSEFGFIKVVGSEGTFAVDATNGAVIAIPNAHSTEQQKRVWYTLGAESHNRQVLDYFLAAGIAREQIGGVAAMTSLYASGKARDAGATRPQVDGWQSVVQRVVNDVPVIDSVVWARMNDQGKVIGEWVYWPPISSKAIDEARELRARTSQEPERAAFLSRLPRDLPAGKVVIRHSSATANGPFEVFASYDVVERRSTRDSTHPSGVEGRVLTASIVRHFDVEGNERKLAGETRSKGGDLPAEKRPPPAAAAR